MFNSSSPPLLVQPASMLQYSLFSPHEGYIIHPLDEKKILACYKDGWTFPVSVHQRKYVSEPPRLLIRNSGGVTTAGTTFNKGYAHQFCREDGQEPQCICKRVIFPDKPDEEWMLIEDTIVMIWFQYGYKAQYCGGSTFEVENNYYGKLIISRLGIKEDFAPRFDKYADIVSEGAAQYRVESRQYYNGGWNVKDRKPEEYLKELLTLNKLERFSSALTFALKRASGV